MNTYYHAKGAEHGDEAVVAVTSIGIGYMVTSVQAYGRRGQGLASKALRECIADADKIGAALYLVVAPDGYPNDLDGDALMAWYRRCGFESFVEDDPEVMVRFPEAHKPTTEERDAHKRAFYQSSV